MGVPRTEELEAALQEARRMREQGNDPQHVAKALLNFHYRYQLMEKVVDAARHYMHSGLAPHEHATLVRAIEAVEKVSRPAGHDDEGFGLE
jgi:hypothetical protein